MPLTGKQASIDGLVPQAKTAGIRAASIDIHVGSILLDGKEYKQSVDIKPQQMFILVSAERVNVKPSYVGYAMPKTSLCKDGILCLNTGILDPGYEGLLSTTAINFEEKSYTISPGDAFLRLVFHRLDGIDAGVVVDSGIKMDDAAYIREAKVDSKRFPPTFLNVPGQIESIADGVLKRHASMVVLILAVFTIVFALWNLGGSMLLARQTDGIAQVRAGLSEIRDELEDTKEHAAILQQALCAAYENTDRNVKHEVVKTFKGDSLRQVMGCS